MGSGASRGANLSENKETRTINNLVAKAEEQPSNQPRAAPTGNDAHAYHGNNNGGQFNNDYDSDDESINSNDSDDTLVLASRMPKYLINNNNDVPDKHYKDGGHLGGEGQKQTVEHDEAFIEMIAKENSYAYSRHVNKSDKQNGSACDPKTAKLNGKKETENPDVSRDSKEEDNSNDTEKMQTYEIDTIGYYIAKATDDANNNYEKENNKQECNDSNNDQDAGSLKQNDNPEDPFEAFKRQYGHTNGKNLSVKKRASANKQTLILAKVGSQYKYIAVPAYLPGQRSYSSKSFVKNYMARAEYIYKVERPEGIDPDNPEGVDENTGSESSKRSRGKKSPGGPKVTKLPSCSLPVNMTPSFYIGGGNGCSLVEAPLTNLGWKRTTDKYDDRFKLKWVECKSKINYGSFREGEQLVNHLPNSHLLTNKLGLLNSLKEYERVTLSTKGRLPRLKMADFHPETYKLDEKSDRELFLDVYKEGEMWICKPVGMNQGKGIFLIRSREAINQVLEEREQKKQTQQKPGRPLQNRIVQRYITQPLLLDGRKFDVRAYMLVASTVPFLILYHKGYVRLSCLKYDTEDMNLGIHLTNQFVQKKDPLYKELKEDTAWSMDKFNDYINTQYRPNSTIEIEEDWVYNSFTKQMQKIMIHCFNSVKHKLQARVGFFDLFGLDFMVDTDFKVHLIEVNTNPALHCNCEAIKEVIPGVVDETLYVAVECFDKTKKNLPLMPLQSLKNFTILYCGTRPNTIIPRQSRSVSPVKDNTADKTKVVTGTGALKRVGSPPRSMVQRASTQSTPLYNSSNRRFSEKKESANSSNNKDAANSQQMPSAKKAVVIVKTSTSAKATVKSEKDEHKEKEEQVRQKGDNSGKEESKNSSDSKNSKASVQTGSKEEPKTSTAVVDTLSKTTDSLNQATSALGKMSVSQNQMGLTDSLLEEVRLKMTHADPVAGPPDADSKPTSARQRENLERGS